MLLHRLWLRRANCTNYGSRVSSRPSLPSIRGRSTRRQINSNEAAGAGLFLAAAGVGSLRPTHKLLGVSLRTYGRYLRDAKTGLRIPNGRRFDEGGSLADGVYWCLPTSPALSHIIDHRRAPGSPGIPRQPAVLNRKAAVTIGRRLPPPAPSGSCSLPGMKTASVTWPVMSASIDYICQNTFAVATWFHGSRLHQSTSYAGSHRGDSRSLAVLPHTSNTY